MGKDAKFVDSLFELTKKEHNELCNWGKKIQILKLLRFRTVEYGYFEEIKQFIKKY